MKVGDLLYYRSAHDEDFEDCSGIAVALEKFGDVWLMKTLWFDDWQYSKEPLPGSIHYDKERVGVLSESR